MNVYRMYRGIRLVILRSSRTNWRLLVCVRKILWSHWYSVWITSESISKLFRIRSIAALCVERAVTILKTFAYFRKLSAVVFVFVPRKLNCTKFGCGWDSICIRKAFSIHSKTVRNSSVPIMRYFYKLSFYA